MAEKYIKIRGKLVAVSEEVHYNYYHMGRQRRTQEEKEGRRQVASYDALDSDENLGIDMLVDEETLSMEDQVLRNLLYEHLRDCIAQLTNEEQEIICALYYEYQTEREYAKTIGISQVAVHRRKHRVLAKLRKLIKNW